MRCSQKSYRRSEVRAPYQGRQEHDEVEELLGGDATGAQQRGRLHALPLGDDAHHQLHEADERQDEEYRREGDVVAEVRHVTFRAVELNLLG